MNTKTSIPTDALKQFRMRVKGDVVLPQSTNYDETRTLHNLVHDKRPAIIVQASDASDVARSIEFARAQGLEIAVRSGGHSFPGHSMNNDGLVIDISRMTNIQIDPQQRTAWAQPGALAGDFANAAQEYGLAVPFGDGESVGLGGITLGGGIGFLVRQHGLAIDHVKAVEVVTANGQIVTATATEHPDLFWALRGGGGNFGVVTGFQYDLVEVGTILGGALLLPATKEVLEGYVRVSEQAPEELTTISFVLRAPPMPFVPEESVGAMVLAIFPCYTGSIEEGQKALDPFRALATPVADVTMPMPYASIYDLTREATQPKREVVRSGFYQQFDGETMERILEFVAAAPTPFCAAQLRPLGGQMAKVDRDATAFSHRDANYLITVIAAGETAQEDGSVSDWALRFWDTIKDRREGAYSNFLENEGEARIRESYATETYERLAEIKRRYDPENVFAGNQNIAPKAMSAAA